ncbi:hypothetical protein SDC9_178022 [bioreactor metagenome]|uniref:Uncharacterized protein n=1 Tax=bioreactor metagenome TaxID=1076179 RepID=A0A645GUK9_9ZZZZ
MQIDFAYELWNDDNISQENKYSVVLVDIPIDRLFPNVKDKDNIWGINKTMGSQLCSHITSLTHLTRQYSGKVMLYENILTKHDCNDKSKLIFTIKKETN